MSPQACIQRVEWFVKQDCTGSWRQGTGKGDTLLLASGKLVWVTVTEFGKADGRKQARDTRIAFGAWEAFDPKGNVLRSAQMGKQGVVLEDHPDPTVFRGNPTRNTLIDRSDRSGHAHTVDPDFAGIGPVEPGDQAKGRGLAAPARPKQGENLAGVQIETDPGDS